MARASLRIAFAQLRQSLSGLVSAGAPDTVRPSPGQTVFAGEHPYLEPTEDFNTPVMAGTGTYPEDCGSKAGLKRFQGSH